MPVVSTPVKKRPLKEASLAMKRSYICVGVRRGARAFARGGFLPGRIIGRKLAAIFAFVVWISPVQFFDERTKLSFVDMAFPSSTWERGQKSQSALIRDNLRIVLLFASLLVPWCLGGEIRGHFCAAAGGVARWIQISTGVPGFGVLSV